MKNYSHHKFSNQSIGTHMIKKYAGSKGIDTTNKEENDLKTTFSA